MDAHPRIGDRVTGQSAAEQSGVADDSRAALTEGNAAYEQRFGHVFLICATGLTGSQLLAALRQRLDHNQEEERQVATAELRTITLLRVQEGPGVMTVSTHVLDASVGTPAAGVAVTLSRLAVTWDDVESGVTDADGRYRFGADTPAGHLPAGLRHRPLLRVPRRPGVLPGGDHRLRGPRAGRRADGRRR